MVTYKTRCLINGNEPDKSYHTACLSIDFLHSNMRLFWFKDIINKGYFPHRNCIPIGGSLSHIFSGTVVQQLTVCQTLFGVGTLLLPYQTLLGIPLLLPFLRATLADHFLKKPNYTHGKFQFQIYSSDSHTQLQCTFVETVWMSTLNHPGLQTVWSIPLHHSVRPCKSTKIK